MRTSQVGKFQKNLNAGVVGLAVLAALAADDADVYGYELAKSSTASAGAPMLASAAKADSKMLASARESRRCFMGRCGSDTQFKFYRSKSSSTKLRVSRHVSRQAASVSRPAAVIR